MLSMSSVLEEVDRFFMQSSNVHEAARAICHELRGLKIDVILTGDFPGDGKPKPVAFPHPNEVAEPDPDGLVFVNLQTLLELKIASGMTAPHRMQDLADAMNLIRVNALPEDYPVHPYVGEKFRELWRLAQVEDD